MRAELHHTYTMGGRTVTTEKVIDLPWVPGAGDYILAYERTGDDERTISIRIDEITHHRKRSDGTWVLSLWEKHYFNDVPRERAIDLIIDSTRSDLEQGWKLTHSWSVIDDAMRDRGLIS